MENRFGQVMGLAQTHAISSIKNIIKKIRDLDWPIMSFIFFSILKLWDSILDSLDYLNMSVQMLSLFGISDFELCFL